MDQIDDLPTLVSARSSRGREAAYPEARPEHPDLWVSVLLYEIPGSTVHHQCLRQVRLSN